MFTLVMRTTKVQIFLFEIRILRQSVGVNNLRDEGNSFLLISNKLRDVLSQKTVMLAAITRRNSNVT
jgi:hypothetical protein